MANCSADGQERYGLAVPSHTQSEAVRPTHRPARRPPPTPGKHDSATVLRQHESVSTRIVLDGLRGEGRRACPLGFVCRSGHTKSSLLFDTPTACLRPSGSELRMKALSGEQAVALASNIMQAKAGGSFPRDGRSGPHHWLRGRSPRGPAFFTPSGYPEEQDSSRRSSEPLRVRGFARSADPEQ